MSAATLRRRLRALEKRLEAPVTLQAPLSAADVFARAVGAPDEWQERILTSTAPRLWLAASRQSGKSATIAAIALAEMMSAPNKTVLILAPVQDQAAELLHRVRAAYTALGRPLGALNDSTLRLTLSNNSRAIALPGTERSIRCYSPSLLLCDESALVPDYVYYAARPLLAATQGRLIAVSSARWQSGWWYEAGQSAEQWERYTVPADLVSRITPDFLEGERLALPYAVFMAEYYAVPMTENNNLFPRELVQNALDNTIEPLW